MKFFRRRRLTEDAQLSITCAKPSRLNSHAIIQASKSGANEQVDEEMIPEL